MSLRVWVHAWQHCCTRTVRCTRRSTLLADGTSIRQLTGITDLLLPFVSFEGETSAFAPDPDLSLPQAMRSITLSENFDNPYSRNNDTNQVRWMRS